MKAKEWLIITAMGVGASAAAANAHAQGVFVFINRAPGHESPVYDTDCQTLLGRGFVAQAYVGDTPQLLAPLEPPIPFITAGYFGQQTVYVPGPAPRQVYVQMRVWEAAAGPTYEVAVDSGGKHGVSNITTVESRPNSGITPDETDDFVSFCLVPEPSTLALSVVGACGLGLALFWRGKS